MQKTKSLKNSKAAASMGTLGLAAMGFIHGDVWIIATVALLGPIWSFITLAAIIALLANTIIFTLDTRARIHFVENLREKVLYRQERLSPLVQKVIHVSKTTGILISAAIVGALPTAFLIHALGYRRPFNYLMATLSSLLFVAVWVSIYSGILFGLKRIIYHM